MLNRKYGYFTIPCKGIECHFLNIEQKFKNRVIRRDIGRHTQRADFFTANYI